MAKSELEDKLDFTSSKFDPQFALENVNESLTRLPCKNAKVFNNLDEYYKKTFVKSFPAAKQKEVFVEPDRKFTAQQIEACKRPINSNWKESPDVLKRMHQAMGPLSLLKKLLGQRIKLSIRRRKLGPVSSHFEQVLGQLVSFDKHLNLILLDVDRVVLLGKEKKKERHCDQLFLRGDNIIFVSKC